MELQKDGQIILNIDGFIISQNLHNKATATSLFGITNKNNLIVVCENCHKAIHYTDNPDLSPYRWDRATTIESIGQEPILPKEASRVESSDSKCEDT